MVRPMPLTPSQSNTLDNLETKAAGLMIDSLGRRWDPVKHPRDSRGRFIETGGIARVGLGGLGKVIRSMLGGKVEVEMSDGSHKIVPHQQLTMVRRPDGSKPTASVRKVVQEDGRREKDPARGDGAKTPDHGDANGNGIPDDLESDPLARHDATDAERDAHNPDDADHNDPEIPEVPEAYSPSREDARQGDIVAITKRSKSGTPMHALARVDEVGEDGRPSKITYGNGKTADHTSLDKADDWAILPAEDLRDPQALLTDSVTDDGRIGMNAHDAANLVEDHAKATHGHGTPKTGDRTGGGTVEPKTVYSDENLVVGAGEKAKNLYLNTDGERANPLATFERTTHGTGKDGTPIERWTATLPDGRKTKGDASYDTMLRNVAKMLNAEPKGKKKPASAPVADATPDNLPEANAPEVHAPDAPAVHAPEQHAAPETPQQVERATRDIAAKQPTAVTRQKSVADRTFYLSPSGNLAVHREGKDRWAVWRRIDKPANPNVGTGEHDMVGDEWYERFPNGHGQPVYLSSQEEFRQKWVGDSERDLDHRGEQAAPAAPAASEADAPIAVGDRVTLPNGKTRGRVHAVREDGTADVVYRSQSNRSNMMWTGRQSDLTRIEEEAPAPVAPEAHADAPEADAKAAEAEETLRRVREEPVENLSDLELGQVAMGLHGADPARTEAALAEVQTRRKAKEATDAPSTSHDAAVQRQADRGIKPGAKVDTDQGPGTVSDVTDRSTAIDLDSGDKIRVQHGTPGHDRITPRQDAEERPAETPARDYAEADTTNEGAPTDDGLREPGREVLAGVPAEGVRDDSRGGEAGVLPVDRDGDGTRGVDADGGELPSEQPTRGQRATAGAAEGNGRGEGSRGSAGGVRVPAEGARDGERDDAVAGGSGAGGSDGGVAPRTASEPEPHDFDPTSQDDLAPSTDAQRLNANMAALRLLRQMQKENRRYATPDEQRTLARFSGWGSLPRVFNPHTAEHKQYGTELRDLLGDAEWNDAQENAVNAHYTDAQIVQPMWGIMEALGFQHGDVLEAGSGTGNFIGFAPDGARMHGIEKNDVTAGIAKYLYPSADIRNESFGDTAVKTNEYDAVIGNVPFSNKIRLFDKIDNPGRKHSIHDHFILKSARGLKPGGVMSVITSTFTLDKNNGEVRKALAAMGMDLIGAVRLPGGAHEKAAGTSVVTDMLVLRKRKDGEAPGDQSWLENVETTLGDGTKARINGYFAEHPENILGETYGDTRFSKDEPNVGVKGDVSTLADQVKEAGDRIVAAAQADGKTFAPADVAAEHVAEPKARAPKKVASTVKAAAGSEVFTPPSARTQQRDKKKIVGQITHVGTERVAGKKAGAKGSLKHQFTIVDFDGSEKPYEPAGATSAGDGKSQADELVALLRLRDVAADLREAEASTTEDDDEIRDLRAELNRVYDDYVAKFGPIGRMTRSKTLVKNINPDDEDAYDGLFEEDGQWYRPSFIKPQMGGIRKDATWWNVTALESDWDEETGKAKKAAIFSKRTIGYRDIPTHADNAADAIRLAKEHDGGRIDMQRVADLLGVSLEEAREQTRGQVFEDHENPGNLVSAHQYLAGNVRRKAAELEALAAENPERWGDAAKAMRAKVPADKRPEAITARLGMTWIPDEDFNQFIRDLTGNQKAKIEVQKDKDTGKASWKVTAVASANNRNRTREETTWGTGRRNSYQIVEALLNGKRLRVEDKDETGKVYLNSKETDAANNKAAEIADEFNRWWRREPERRERLQKAYNEKYRSYTDVDYVDSPYAEYIGMSDAITLDGHQNDSVAMAKDLPSVLLAHEVGTGKTFTMAAAVMEKKRLGQVNKPVVVVPNHLLEQFVREFKILYPNANLLAADSNSVSDVNDRRRFVAQAASHDWDAVVMTKNGFKYIPISEETALANDEEKIQGLIDQRDQILMEKGETKQVKELAAKIANAKEKVKEQRDRIKRDGGALDFEAIGFDYVVVDEAHEYKNDVIESDERALQNLKGNTFAIDLREKLDWLRENNAKTGRKSVALFATGTPVSNSTREFYVMMRYLRPDLLDEAGFDTFDKFRKSFLETEERVEQDVAGRTRVKLREGDKLVNAGELKRLWVQFADVVTADDIGLERPKVKGGKGNKITVEPTSNLRKFMAYLKYRQANLPKKFKPEPGDDTAIAIGTDGLAAAVDLRLIPDEKLEAAGIDPRSLTDADGKIPDVGDRLLAEWRRTKDMRFQVKRGTDADGNEFPMHETPGALQVVFCDKGVPGGSSKFNFYQGLKDYLVAGGMKPSEVAFIHDADGDAAKMGKLSEACRTGEVKVLIGSYPKMGTGLNVQNRLSRVTHVHGVYRPDQIEQANGRGIRRGNQFDEVELDYYVVPGSNEGYQWAHVSRKDNFLRQFDEADLDATIIGDIEDEGLSESDMIAAAGSEDPLFLEEAELGLALRKLRGRHTQWVGANEDYTRAISQGTAKIDHLNRQIANLRAAAPKVKDVSGDNFAMSIRPDRYSQPVDFTDKKEALEALGKAVENIDTTYAPVGEGQKVQIGTYGGMDVFAWTSKSFAGSVKIRFGMAEHDPNRPYYRQPDMLDLNSTGIDPGAAGTQGTLTRLENMLKSISTRPADLQHEIDKAQGEVDEARASRTDSFPDTDELNALEARSTALRDLMKHRERSGGKTTEDEAPLRDLYDLATERWKTIRDERLKTSDAPKKKEIGEARSSRRKIKSQAKAAQRALTGEEAPKPRTRQENASQDIAGRERTVTGNARQGRQPGSRQPAGQRPRSEKGTDSEGGDADADGEGPTLTLNADTMEPVETPEKAEQDVNEAAALEAVAESNPDSEDPKADAEAILEAYDGDTTGEPTTDDAPKDAVLTPAEEPEEEPTMTITPAGDVVEPEAAPSSEIPEYGQEITLADGRHLTFEQDTFAGGFGARDEDGNPVTLTDDELIGWKPYEAPKDEADTAIDGLDAAPAPKADTAAPERAPKTPSTPAQRPTGAAPSKQDGLEFTDVESTPDAPTIGDAIAEQDAALASAKRGEAAYAKPELRKDGVVFITDPKTGREIHLGRVYKDEVGNPSARGGAYTTVWRADYHSSNGTKYPSRLPKEFGTRREAMDALIADKRAERRANLKGLTLNEPQADTTPDTTPEPPRAPEAAETADTMTIAPEDLPRVDDAGDGNDEPPTPEVAQAADEPEEPTGAAGESEADADDAGEAAAEQQVEQAAEEARTEAEQEALADGATEAEATEAGEHAAAAVVANHETSDADAAGERGLVPDPSAEEKAAAGEPKTPRQLEGEKYPLNPEQQVIADRVVADKKDVLVRAKAGSGKTSTLEAIARRLEVLRPKDKALYICFNKTVQVEAEGRMPKNVESRTGHSLAYQWVDGMFPGFIDTKVGRNKKRPTRYMLRKDSEVAEHLGIRQDMPTKDSNTTLTPRRQAALALKAVANYANSADDELGYEHFLDSERGDLLAALPERERVRMLGYAKAAWADIQGADGKIKPSFDHLRKMWALSKPDLSKPGAGNKRGAQVLFLDEAQDTPPVLAKVVADQKMQKVIVGDADQQIYTFTGAINYLDNVNVDEGDDLPLTKSYRFGPRIADIANRFLQVLGSKERVIGGGSTEGNILEPDTMTDADAILTRSNAGMIGEILSEQGRGRKVAITEGTKKDLESFVASAKYLMGVGDAPATMHEDLAPFDTWADVEKAIEEDGDPKLTMLQRLVNEHGINGLQDVVDSVMVYDGDKADDAGVLPVGKSGLLEKVRVTQGENGRYYLVGDTFPLNEAVKEDTGRGMTQYGFGFPEQVPGGKGKGWILPTDDADREAALDRLREQFGTTAPTSAAEKPDVIVVTAHKSKGLEWDKVKIGMDFKGPKVDKETGQETMPDAEELRLAYVAVTRAGKELDPGSLAWVFDKSSANGGERDEKRDADVPETVNAPQAEETNVPEPVAADADQPNEAPAADADRPEEHDAPEADQADADQPNETDEPAADDATDTDDEEAKRREDRKRYDPNPDPDNNNNNGGTGGPGGAMLPPPPVPDLPMFGFPEGGREAGHTPEGAKIGDLSDDDLKGELSWVIRKQMEAVGTDTAEQVIPDLLAYGDELRAEHERRQNGEGGPDENTVGSLRAGERIRYQGQTWTVDTIDAPFGGERRVVILPDGQGVPVGRVVRWSVDKPVEKVEFNAPEGDSTPDTVDAPEAPAADTAPVETVSGPDYGNVPDGYPETHHDLDWNGGNPFNLAPVGHLEVSKGLADELRTYLENGDSDGIDQGYTLDGTRMVVHNRPAALSALDAIADIADNQAGDSAQSFGFRGAARARRDQAVKTFHAIKGMDEAPIADAAVKWRNESIRPDELQVGDVIVGKRRSDGEQGFLQVESVQQSGTHLVVTGTNAEGERDTVMVPAHLWANRVGTKGGAPAWHAPLDEQGPRETAGPEHPSNLRVGDVIDAKAKFVGDKVARRGRWTVTGEPVKKGMFWQVPVVNDRGEAGWATLGDNRPVQVLERGPKADLPETDANGFEPGELREGDVPATQADLDELFGTDTADTTEVTPEATPIEDRPEPRVNGTLPNQQGLDVPPDTEDGLYHHDQVEFLDKTGQRVVVTDMDGNTHVGNFVHTTKGTWTFQPLGKHEGDTITFGPDDIDTIRGLGQIEAPANEVNAENLRPGTHVAFRRDGVLRDGVLEGVTGEPGKRRAVIRDAFGNTYESKVGALVRPVVATYPEGQEPTEPRFAPVSGVWQSNGRGVTAGVKGEWVAGIQPTADGRFEWQVDYPQGGRGRKTGHADSLEEAKTAVDLEIADAFDAGVPISTVPGNDEAEHKAKSAEWFPEAQQDAKQRPGVTPEGEKAPDIDGASATWAQPEHVQAGDLVEVSGDNGHGSGTTVTGTALGDAEPVAVHSGGSKRPKKGTRITVGGERDGEGDRETVLTPESSLVPVAHRDEATEGDGSNPQTAYESQILSGQTAAQIQTDQHGLGIYPGSVVSDGRGRTGVVTETWDNEVAVRWQGSDDDEKVRPGLLTVEQQARPDGWTRDGHLVAPGHMVEFEDKVGRVKSVSGDNITVETADGDRVVSAEGLRVVGKVSDLDALSDSTAYPEPPSTEGLDVRPVAPVKPSDLPEGAKAVTPNWTDADYSALNGLGLDTDAVTPMDVQDVAARLRHRMPITPEQANALAAWIRTLISPDMPRGKRKPLSRLANTLEFIGGGRQNPDGGPEAPSLVKVRDLALGDMIAVPTPGGDIEPGRVRALFPTHNGNAVDVVVEHGDGRWTHTSLQTDGDVYVLPDVEEPIEAPAAPVQTEVEADAPFTKPRIEDRAEQAVDSVIDAAVGDPDSKPESMEALGEQIAAAKDKAKKKRKNAKRRGKRSLDHSGISEQSSTAADHAAEQAADKAADKAHQHMEATVADAEPLPGESDSDAAERTRDRLNEIADEIDTDGLAGDAVESMLADEAGDTDLEPTPAERAAAQRDVNAALRADLFAMAAELARQGDDVSANALALIAARLSGSPNEAEIQRAVAALTMGRTVTPQKRASIASRVRALFGRVRRAFADRVAAIRNSRGIRSLRAAVKAARAEWKGDDAGVTSLVDHAAGVVSKRDLPGPETGEPVGFADRVAFWREQLPSDSGMFGRTDAPTKGFRGLTLARLRSGEPLAAEDLTGSRLDRAADGGPGEAAVAHYEAVKGLGAAVHDDVMARVRAAAPELGADPLETVREARRYADQIAHEDRGDLTDKELKRLRKKAKADAEAAERTFFNARAKATRDALEQVRPMGPRGAAALHVESRGSDSDEAKALDWAQQWLPTDWLATAGTVEAKAGRMPSYADGEITVAPLTEGKVDGSGLYGASALRGLAHHLETTVPGLREAGWVHHWAKTSEGEPGRRTRRGKHRRTWFKDQYPGIGLTVEHGATRGGWDGNEQDIEKHTGWIPAGLEELFGEQMKDDDLRKAMMGLLAWLRMKG